MGNGDKNLEVIPYGHILREPSGNFFPYDVQIDRFVDGVNTLDGGE